MHTSTPDHQRFEMNRKSELLRPMIVGKDIVQYSTRTDVTAKDSMRAHHDTVLKDAKVQYSTLDTLMRAQQPYIDYDNASRVDPQTNSWNWPPPYGNYSLLVTNIADASN